MLVRSRAAVPVLLLPGNAHVHSLCADHGVHVTSSVFGSRARAWHRIDVQLRTLTVDIHPLVLIDVSISHAS